MRCIPPSSSREHCVLFQRVLNQLVSRRIPPLGPLTCLGQLLAAEELLDTFAGRERELEGYEYLHERVLTYILTNTDLQRGPWLRKGGAVCDILEAARLFRHLWVRIGNPPGSFGAAFSSRGCNS